MSSSKTERGTCLHSHITEIKRKVWAYIVNTWQYIANSVSLFPSTVDFCASCLNVSDCESSLYLTSEILRNQNTCTHVITQIKTLIFRTLLVTCNLTSTINKKQMYRKQACIWERKSICSIFFNKASPFFQLSFVYRSWHWTSKPRSGLFLLLHRCHIARVEPRCRVFPRAEPVWPRWLHPCQLGKYSKRYHLSGFVLDNTVSNTQISTIESLTKKSDTD